MRVGVQPTVYANSNLSVLALAFLFCIPALSTAADDVPRTRGAASDSLFFDETPVVEAASLHTQTLQEAPANVTVITRQDIRNYGYRTLAEALENTRGFYVAHDGGMTYVGVRGFSLLGDYNSRFLVMINGHYLTDNVFNSMYMFGRDFPIEMDLVERIEVIRGPSSALYGSNGVFTTINVVTRSPVDADRARVTADLGSLGEKQTSVSASVYLGKGANLLVAGSGFHSSGRTVFAPELGRSADAVTADKGFHTFANLIWRNWSVLAAFGDREVLLPSGTYGASFGDKGTRSRDAHNFVEGAYTREVGASGRLRWRLYYDQFRYWGRYDTELEDGVIEDSRDSAFGDWAGTQLSYSLSMKRFGILTVGGEVNADIRNVQQERVVVPEPYLRLYVSQRNRSYGVFAQQEWKLSKRWTAYLGARLDDANHFRRAISPRLALIYRASADSAYKLMYGRAFRNPSTYEMFYGGDAIPYAQNLGLRPELVDTFEAGVERKLHRTVSLTASAYHYRLRELIEGRELENGKFQYQNISKARATGVGLEALARPGARLEVSAAVTLEKTENCTTGSVLENSPRRLAHFRAAVPVSKGRLTISSAARYMSSRTSSFADLVIPSLFLADATATTNKLHNNFDLQFGVRNLLDRRYSDPMSAEHLMREMPGAGRTAFVRLIWHWQE